MMQSKDIIYIYTEYIHIDIHISMHYFNVERKSEYWG